jgi:hypothetical protein
MHYILYYFDSPASPDAKYNDLDLSPTCPTTITLLLATSDFFFHDEMVSAISIATDSCTVTMI